MVGRPVVVNRPVVVGRPVVGGTRFGGPRGGRRPVMGVGVMGGGRRRRC